MRKKVISQSSLMLLAQLLTKALSFFYTLFLARALGVDNFGLYSAAFAYFALFSAIGDLGINRYLTRELAINQERVPELLPKALGFRLLLVLLLFLIFYVGLNNWDQNLNRVGLAVLVASAVFPQAISQSLESMYVAVEKFRIISLGQILLNLFIAGLGIFLILQGWGVLGAGVAVVGGYLFQLIFYTLTFFYSNYQLHLKLLTQKFSETFIHIIQGSLPYGVLAVIGLIYFRIDLLLLNYLRGNYETGIYGAGYKFLEAIVFVPSTISLVLFPQLARLHLNDSHELKKYFWNIIWVMAILGLIFSFAFWFILPFIIQFFLPQYQESINIIKILALAIPFMFIHVPLSQIVLSSDKYLRQIITFSLIPLSFNIFTNLLFIPKYGGIAAAWITVLSDILSLIIVMLLIRLCLRLADE